MAINETAWAIVEHSLPNHFIGSTGPCCDRCSEMLTVVENALSIGYENGYVAYKDDPEMDCTPFAHPAWWRGYDHANATLVNEINRILDGKEENGGFCNEPWQSLKTRLFDIRGMLYIAEHIICTIQSSRLPKMCKHSIEKWYEIRSEYNLRTRKKE